MRRLVIGWAVCAVVALGGYLLYTQIQDSATESKVCAGVGLEGPEASTPRAALDGYLAEVGGAPSDWDQTDRAFSTGTEFGRSGRRSPEPDVAVVIVDGVAGEGFRVTGGCVGVGEAYYN